jgi:hypothetical protein
MASRRCFTGMAEKFKRAHAFGRPAQFATFAIALIFRGDASAMTITPNFTSAFVTAFGTGGEDAFDAAAAVYTSTFDNPININITVDVNSADEAQLGQSSTYVSELSWSTIYNFVKNNDNSAAGQSAAQLTSIGAGGSITQANPTGNGNFWMTTAEAKALGIISNNLNTDGFIYIGTDFTYTYSDSGGVAPGTFDLTDIFSHEMSEIMGRQGLSGVTFAGAANSYELLDALSFQSAGTREAGNTGGWFSINDGNTLLMEYNDSALNGGDTRDWASGSNDSYNAFTNSGVLDPVSAVDLEEMNVLGYNLTTTATVPEPSTGIFLISALLAGCFIRRRANF